VFVSGSDTGHEEVQGIDREAGCKGVPMLRKLNPVGPAFPEKRRANQDLPTVFVKSKG
jgi:hypothetical protein